MICNSPSFHYYYNLAQVIDSIMLSFVIYTDHLSVTQNWHSCFWLSVVVVRAHAHLGGENVSEVENEIATVIADILLDKSSDQRSRILELVQHKVIAGNKGQSIVLYIYCQTTEELQQLHEALSTGQLQYSVELCFNSLLTRSQKIAVAAITVSNEEFQKARMYFEGQNLFPIHLIQ